VSRSPSLLRAGCHPHAAQHVNTEYSLGPLPFVPHQLLKRVHADLLGGSHPGAHDHRLGDAHALYQEGNPDLVAGTNAAPWASRRASSSSPMPVPTSTRGQQYWHDPVRCGRCNVRDVEGLAASVVLIAILLGVLFLIGGLVYLLAQRLPRRSPGPPRKPVNRRIGIGSIILVLLLIGLWAGIRSASNPQPQPAGQLNCPTGGIWTPVQMLCEQL
jgi:hypothetical protein